MRGGLLEDHSAVFGVLAQIEALGLELLELRQVRLVTVVATPGTDGVAITIIR